jgi:hypothetical protein
VLLPLVAAKRRKRFNGIYGGWGGGGVNVVSDSHALRGAVFALPDPPGSMSSQLQIAAADVTVQSSHAQGRGPVMTDRALQLSTGWCCCLQRLMLSLFVLQVLFGCR